MAGARNKSGRSRQFRDAERAEIDCAVPVKLHTEVNELSSIAPDRATNCALSRSDIRIVVDRKSALRGEFNSGFNCHFFLTVFGRTISARGAPCE